METHCRLFPSAGAARSEKRDRQSPEEMEVISSIVQAKIKVHPVTKLPKIL